MNNQVSNKTFAERVQPELYKDFTARRDELVLSTLVKMEAARTKHLETLAELLPSLAALKVASLESFMFLNAFGVGVKNFREFTFEQAMSYTPPKTVEPTEASTVQLCSRAAEWVQSKLSGFSRVGLDLPERVRRTAELQAKFHQNKEGITSELFKTSRERAWALASEIDTVCGRAQSVPHNRAGEFRLLEAITRGLRSFSQDDMLACEISVRGIAGEGVISKVNHLEMIKMIESSIARISEGVSEGAYSRPTEAREILKQHARAASELKMPPRVSLDRHEVLILRYFSLMESLSNPRLEEGARRRYTEMRDELVPDLQSMNRRDRAHSVKMLQRLGKAAGWEIIPNGIDDAFWVKIGEPATSSRVVSEPIGAPVHVALRPYLQDAGRKVAGLNVKQLERELTVGTVEAIVRELGAIIPDADDVTAILSANPRLFLEFQKGERGNFSEFLKALRDVVPALAAIRARGGDVLASQLATAESARALVEAEARRDAFMKSKDEVLSILADFGCEEPETSLIVLRRGTLVKGSYQTVSERTFDDFAKKGVDAADEIKVPAIREELLRLGLLSKRADGALSLPIRGEGKRGTLLAWIRAHHPGADIA